MQSAPAASEIPPPVSRSLSLPPPRAQAKPETYSVVVNNVRVQDLLFALARDARVNVDIHPGISGTVTLNALDQTLPQLLTRIARQTDMRFELDGPNLVVMPDTPYLRSYRVDYVNLNRDASSSVSIASQIGSAASTGNSGGNQPTAMASGNSSQSRIDNTSRHRFWDSLVQNVKDLLRETDKVFPEGKGETTIQQTSSQTLSPLATSAITAALGQNSATAGSSANAPAPGMLGTSANESTTVRTVTFREAASVIANIETGVLSVRATSRQHEKVQEFLDKVSHRARRQVLIEATIAEVQLSRNYQQGINWSALNLFDTGLRVIQGAAGALTAPASSFIELGYTSRGGNFDGAIKLLESFGNVKVLSSPKLSVLNNQSAVLKVVDDNIYFTIDVDEREGNQNAQARTIYTTTVHSVPVGLVMNITPQIGDDDNITLGVRPTLSRVIGQAVDPNPVLKDKGIVNTIPVIRAREMDSVMRVGNGNIAVLGGLMEDLLDNRTDAVPGISSLSFIGALFQNRDDTQRKTELVIFIRPTIVRDTSIAGDYAGQRDLLPRPDYFEHLVGPQLIPPLPERAGGKAP
ncbi:MAG: pilus (MSHA type) biogenesis protein MshL [Moraxellaceae bacterium]|nr:pilus (MSHA type) biogenesis protein MshL [Moraxellaceae bacterium]